MLSLSFILNVVDASLITLLITRSKLFSYTCTTHKAVEAILYATHNAIGATSSTPHNAVDSNLATVSLYNWRIC